MARLNDTLAIWEHRDKLDASGHLEDEHELDFQIDSSGENPRVFFVPSHEARPVHIITVASGDEVGYDRRSPGYVGRQADRPGTDRNPRVTRELIAHWWAALLTDAFRVAVLNEEPVATVGVDQARVLRNLHEQMSVGTDTEAGHHDRDVASGVLSAEIEEAMTRLSGAQGKELESLPREVPIDFEISRDHDHGDE